MTTIQSIDSRGNPRWTPVPYGYTVERVIEILSGAGHTEITTAGDAAA
jgi:hypothetical protein